jgi:hypothetical protein
MLEELGLLELPPQAASSAAAERAETISNDRLIVEFIVVSLEVEVSSVGGARTCVHRG